MLPPMAQVPSCLDDPTLPTRHPPGSAAKIAVMAARAALRLPLFHRQDGPRAPLQPPRLANGRDATGRPPRRLRPSDLCCRCDPAIKAREAARKRAARAARKGPVR